MGIKFFSLIGVILLLSACTGIGNAAQSAASIQGVSSPSPSPSPSPAPSPSPNPAPATSHLTKMCQTRSSAQNEVYGLAVATNLPFSTSFLSDWSAQPSSGGFYGMQTMDTCRIQPDGFVTWHNKVAARVEVDPGDDVLNSGGERSEVFSMQDKTGKAISETASSGVVYYAISYYFPTTWDGTQLSGDGESWSYVMQFHPNNSGALIGLGASRTGTGLPQKYYFQGSQQHDLANGSLITLGAWTDFIFQFNWSSGALNIYRRDEGQTKFTLVLSINDPAMLPDSAGGYFKEGLYRGPDVNGRTDVLWIGPAARGPSFSSVEQAAFGTNNGF